MNPVDSESNSVHVWQSAHICPSCSYVIDLSELDLIAITTGIVTCPRCGWSGRIEIQIVDADRSR
jgi:predicted  nucleic acid-binding Zn-ribbon protein